VHLEGVDATDLTVVPLYTERFVLAANHRLLPEDWGDRIAWSELSQLPLCMLAPSHSSRQLINKLIGEDGLALRPHIETDSVAAIYALVETGPWAGVVPREWIHAFSHSPEIRIAAIEEPSVTSTVNLAISASLPGSPLARALAAAAGQLSLDEHFEQALTAGPR
jgi:DNA-binding transcriptional LysR family regulator